MLNDAELKRLRKRAIRFCAFMGFPQLAEDFAQEFLIRKFQNENMGFRRSFVDFIRKELGRTLDCKSKKINIRSRDRKREQLFYAQIFDEETLDVTTQRIMRPSPEYVRVCLDYNADPVKKMILEQVIARLPRRKRDILKLYLQGYRLEEIAQKFDVVESRISQIMSEIKADLRDILEVDG